MGLPLGLGWSRFGFLATKCYCLATWHGYGGQKPILVAGSISVALRS
jgi:hypothetical protein